MNWVDNAIPRSISIYVLVGILIGGSAVGGYLLGSRNESRHNVKEITKTVYVPVKEIQEVQVRNVEREAVLAKELATARLSVQSLQRRLDSVPTNSCPVSPDAVGVLNEAITGRPEANPSGVPDGQTTTVTDLTNWSLTAIAQYNELSAKYNAWVDWAQEELIDPQRTTTR